MKQRRFAKVLSWILAALLVISLLPTSMLQVRAEEGETSNRAWEWTRLAGANRYHTATLATQVVFEDGSCEKIIIASGQAFPDALSGSALAGALGCPILLTNTKKLADETKAEIQRLAAPNCQVLILGGTGAVSEAVENAILKLGIKGLTTKRVAGANRDETMRAVYAEGNFPAGGTIIVATGYAYADVLSISPYAYAAKAPIILTKKNGTLTPEAKALLENEAKPSKVIIIGGAGVVTEATENYLKGLSEGVQVMRLAGANRYATSAEIMKWELGLNAEAPFQPDVEMHIDGMGVATGTGFADALGATSLLGKIASPLLLVADNNKNNKAATQANIDELIAPYAADMTKGYIFGGTGAISAQIEGWLNEAVPEAGPTIYETPEEILKALYELGDNEVLSDGYLYELEGKITAVVTPYSSRYNNITVNMEIEGLEQYPVQAFRLTAEETNTEMSEAVKVLKTGDTIKVKGALKNYVSNSGVSTKEFDAGCLLIGYTEGTQGPTIYETPEEILKALYELEPGQVLSDGYLYELEGTITEVNTAYNSNYNNISVTIVVEGFDEYPVQAYRLTAEETNEEMSAALKVLKVGDTITVKGALKRYNDTREFDAGCLLIGYTEGEAPQPGEDLVEDKEYTVDELLAAMVNYIANQTSAVECTVTGVATSSTYNENHSSYTIWLQSNDGATAQAFKLYSVALAEGIEGDYTADNALAGKVVTCRGYVKLYNNDYEMPYLGAESSPTGEAYTPQVTKIEDGEQPPEVNDQDKVDYEAGKLSLPEEVSEAGPLTLPTPEKYEDVQIAWVSDSELAVVDEAAGTLTITLPEEDTTVNVTATLSLGDATATKNFPILIKASEVVIYETPEEILKALYELGDNKVLSDGYLYELEGKITAVVTPYSSRYNNITVNMEIEGLEQYPVQAFRLTAEETNTEMSAAVKVLKTGDTIKVKGALKNYVNNSGVSTKEFDAGCLLIGYTEGTQGPTIYETPEEILKALYELEPGQVLSDGYLYELEGTITEVNTAYNSNYNNISVTIVVEGFDEYPVQAYRLTAEGTNEEMSAALKVLKVGDTIKVKGALKRYNDTREFDAGCLLIDYTAGGEEPPVVSDQEKVNAEKDALTLTEEGEALTVSEDVEITLPAPKTYPEVQIAWQSDKENVVVNDGKLVITQVEEEVVANVTATLSLNEASAEKTFVITVKAKGSEEPKKAVWTKVAWADITEDDTIAITVTKSGTNAGTYVLTSDVTSAGGPPAATLTVTPQDGKFETETADKYAWVRIPTEGGYFFQRGDDPTLYLYMTDDNNGVRIGTLEAAGDGAVLTLDENSGYLRAVAFERYLGVFNAQDWRCYNSPTASNIANQTIEFWKFSEGGEEPPVEPNDEEKVQTEYENLSLGPISAGPGVVSEDMTYELPVAGSTYSDVSISWESDADSVAVVDKNLVITQIETEVVAHVKATLVLNDATKEKTFTITVTAKASGEEETVTESFVIGELPQYTAQTNIDSLTVGNIQITFDQGTATTHTRFWNNDIRTYQGSTFTIATVDGARIKSIAITFSSGYTNCTPEPNTYTLDGTVGTWTGNQNSVSFACAGQVRIVSMEVIYVKGE